MNSVQRVHRLLQQGCVPFDVLRHPEAPTAQRLAEREHVSGHQVAKVVIAIVDNKPVELVLPATRHVILARVQELFQAADARLATEAEIQCIFADFEPGATPPLRDVPHVPIVVDKSLAMEDTIVFAAGTHEDAVRVQFSDWFGLVKPEVARFAALREASAPSAGLAPLPRTDEVRELRELMVDLLDVLHLQAREIERFASHVEQHTPRMLRVLQLPLVVSELSALHVRMMNLH